MNSRAELGRKVMLVVVWALAIAGGLSALTAHALPRYSARYEQNCMLCHANPAGSGMRSTYATQQIVPKELAWSKTAPAVMANIDPQISKNVTIGADFREMYVATDYASTEPIQQGFFQMQQAIYLLFQLDPKFSLYYDRGSSDTYEVFGMAHVLPVSGYLKAGRFVPSYGWKFDDHTMYVRSELGFFPPTNNDVGAEIGFTPEHFDLQLDVVNGNRGSTQNDDRKPAELLNTIYRFHAGPFGMAAGVEGYHRPTRSEALDMAGARGYLTWSSLTWLGEWDRVRHDPTATGPTVTGQVTSHELSWLAHQGLDVLATYDFFDPDIDRLSGANSRWGGGVHLMPKPFLTCDVLFRRTHVDARPGLPDVDSNEGVFQLHLLF
jgi:hypothetical protein